MERGTITCFLCGGVHIYPGPRFGKHLLHEHGVVFNQEYLVSVSQYKDSYAILPPIQPRSSSSRVDQVSQTEDVVSSSCSNCAKPMDGFLTSTPVQKVFPRWFDNPSQQHRESPRNNVLHESETWNPGLCADREQSLPSSSSSGPVVPERSGFTFKCALCNYVTTSDSGFWGHITRKHGLEFKKYKDEYGSNKTPIHSGKFECRICQASLQHLPNCVDKHLKVQHSMSWAQYIDWFKNNAGKENVAVKAEVVEANGDDVIQKEQNLVFTEEGCREEELHESQDVETDEIKQQLQSPGQVDQSQNLEEDLRLTEDELSKNEAQVENIFTNAVKVKQEVDQSFMNSVHPNTNEKPDIVRLLGHQSDGGDKKSKTMPSLLQGMKNASNSNSKPQNIRDKTNKICSKCDLSFPSRVLFLRHCQDVHKMKFKNKFGSPLVLSQKTLVVGAEQPEEDSLAVPRMMKTALPSYLGFIPSPSRTGLQSPSTTLPQSPSPSPSPCTQSKSTFRSISHLQSPDSVSSPAHACPHCSKVFSSSGNKERHVRLSCLMREPSAVQRKDKPAEGEGFKCRKCGKVYLKLGYLTRHNMSSCTGTGNK